MVGIAGGAYYLYSHHKDGDNEGDREPSKPSKPGDPGDENPGEEPDKDPITPEDLGLIELTDDMSLEERANALEHNRQILEQLLNGD